MTNWRFWERKSVGEQDDGKGLTDHGIFNSTAEFAEELEGMLKKGYCRTNHAEIRDSI